MDRDGTLVRDIDLLHRIEDLELLPFSAGAIKKINESEYLSFLITNQPVVARNLCDISMIKHIHDKLETLLGREGAYLNDIYFCPHHPDKGYPDENPDFKVDCDCRKPKTGMISKAVKDYNVDVESSWFVGDMTADIQTGKNAGMKTVLVRTGRGGDDGKFEVTPDYIFDNIEEAVNFILSQ
jgi:histidinol-phosphate phosphatase family protein